MIVNSIKEIAIGFSLMWLLVFIRGGKFKIQGVASILMAGFICYGLGSIVLAVLK